MRILPVNSINLYKGNSALQNDNRFKTNYGLHMSEPLNKDTVSFKCTVKFEEILKTTAQKNNEKLKIPAKNYMAVLQAIALDLKDYGVSFNRSLNEPTSIKSAKSVISKIKRSKTFKVPDRIRGTIYCKNIYDLSVLFDKIIPALKEYGYVIANTELSLEEALKRGYKPTAEEIKKGEVIYPDLDIRLGDDIKNIESIPEDKKYCLSKPQPSGYEDIQIRLQKVDDTSQKSLKQFPKQRFWHELIILVGEEYDKTKHDESDNIYTYTRQFQELNLYGNKDSGEILELIKRYINLIKKTFSNEISQKVYENAKSKDLYGITDFLPITLTQIDEHSLTECYDNIEKLTKSYYANKIRGKNKTEKTIKTILKEREEDLEKLKTIRQGLTKAVDFYKNYYNKPVEVKKAKK